MYVSVLSEKTPVDEAGIDTAGPDAGEAALARRVRVEEFVIVLD